jgi:hypothetical protein
MSDANYLYVDSSLNSLEFINSLIIKLEKKIGIVAKRKCHLASGELCMGSF